MSAWAELPDHAHPVSTGSTTLYPVHVTSTLFGGVGFVSSLFAQKVRFENAKRVVNVEGRNDT